MVHVELLAPRQGRVRALLLHELLERCDRLVGVVLGEDARAAPLHAQAGESDRAALAPQVLEADSA